LATGQGESTVHLIKGSVIQTWSQRMILASDAGMAPDRAGYEGWIQREDSARAG
jgi:hypothetical protein